jgi:(1->4)-alpha-D-glucan 1-alpha-D-glucosylmutase
MPEFRATYRLQLHAGFPLSRVRELVPYLSRLGISHLHCSPMLRARQGSTHGYDVVDPNALGPELGTEADLEALHQDLAARGMGIVLDIVPNHMAASPENAAWEDVLAHGPASAFARWFDIDWRASERELRARVLVPVLGDLRSRVLERGEIALEVRNGLPRVRYFEHGFPLDPSTTPRILAAGLERCEAALGRDHRDCEAVRAVIRSLRALPRRLATRPKAVARRREESARTLTALRELAAARPHVASGLGEGAAAWTAGPEGRVRLSRLLDAQVYRLVHWRRAAREINYRRFFDVNDLIALHMEDPEVFAQTHALVLEWRRRGWVEGFRIDHPDGLLDPRAYLERLGAAAFPERGDRQAAIWVEKILSHGERLRSEWPVAGTTGYDFLNETEALFVAPAGFDAIRREYHRIVRHPLGFTHAAQAGKRLILESGLSAGVRRLADRLLRLEAPGAPRVPVHALSRAIVEAVVALPVYRTYVDDRSPVPTGEDLRLLAGALAEARSRGRAGADALDLLESALLGADGPRLRFVQRFQQLSGPAMAKGVEDTAFYVYTPLLSRNEVGGDPEGALDRAVDAFHTGNADRAARFPDSMLAVTTHDTKRNADVRARLDALSEIAGNWADRLYSWRRSNAPFKSAVRGRKLPDDNTVQHLFQALVALWPLEPLGVGDVETLRERLSAYMLKAARESKQRTSWVDPDPEFEDALRADVEAILSPDRAPRLLDDVEQFARLVGRAGLLNSLSRTVLHLASPGIPDLYQGDELWSFALVDPDNRRPVDFGERAGKLEEVERGFERDAPARREFLRDLVLRAEDGRLKLHVIRAALGARKRWGDAFRSRVYLPLAAQGPESARVVAFQRGSGRARLVAIVSRFHLAGRPWTSSWLTLPHGSRWHCALSGETLEAGDDGRLPLDRVFGILPVALLLSEPLA